MAAATSGADVITVGADGYAPGSEALQILQRCGVHTDGVEQSRPPTGIAHSTVDGKGENGIVVVIVVVSGANYRL